MRSTTSIRHAVHHSEPAASPFNRTNPISLTDVGHYEVLCGPSCRPNFVMFGRQTRNASQCFMAFMKDDEGCSQNLHGTQTQGHPKGCDAAAREQLAAFLRLLLVADSRISTGKVSSSPMDLPVAAVGLDKLNLALAEPLQMVTLAAAARRVGLECRRRRLQDGKHYLQIGSDGSGTFARLGNATGTETWSIITRPSVFASFESYAIILGQLIGKDAMDASKITRLDLAIDIRWHLKDLLKSLDVRGKQKAVRFEDKGGRITGAMFGTGHEKLVVYDKAAEQGSLPPLSRLELQLSGVRLPTKSLCRLKDCLTSSDFQPFSDFDLFSLRLVGLNGSYSDEHKERYQRLETLLNYHGYHATRKELGQNRNFERDYGRMMMKASFPIQLTEVFQMGIRDFFE